MTALKLNFSTSAYIRSHSKAPKGTGRWIFAQQLRTGEGDPIFTPYPMTLTEAKKWLRQHLADQGATGSIYITICP